MKRGRKPKKALQEPTVKVIRDCRDGRLDYELPAHVAKALYEAGKLRWDCTNYCYTE